MASNVETRVLVEVLPATLIHFPSAIKNKRHIPEQLADVVKLIKKGVSEGPALAGIACKDMLRWANHPLKDNRTKPASVKRRLKAFKLSPKAIAKLSSLATKKKISETQIVEELILSI